MKIVKINESQLQEIVDIEGNRTTSKVPIQKSIVSVNIEPNEDEDIENDPITTDTHRDDTFQPTSIYTQAGLGIGISENNKSVFEDVINSKENNEEIMDISKLGELFTLPNLESLSKSLVKDLKEVSENEYSDVSLIVLNYIVKSLNIRNIDKRLLDIVKSNII